jgi:hypothetical protein
MRNKRHITTTLFIASILWLPFAMQTGAITGKLVGVSDVGRTVRVATSNSDGYGREVRPHTPGTLANPGFEGQPMKSVYFFAGQWRFPGPAFYDGPVPGVRLSPASNDCLYTIFPVDGARHLGWSESSEKREYVVNLMLAAGVNVVNMSYWGPPNTDRWAFWAPMQTAAGAHNELFDATVGKPVLIAPYIENGIATLGQTQTGCHGDIGPGGESAGYNFLDVFPGTSDDPAPQLVEQIVDLVHRYLLEPENPAWPGKWAQMYDRSGKPRYVVSLIHVGSNQPGVTHETFAQGFAWVADRVYNETGVRVGFTLDALPPEHNARFKPSPAQTGRLLAQQPAVLAIQPFNPEVFTGRCLTGEDCDAVSGSIRLEELLTWKEQFVSSWVSTGIPVILDVSPGYDARIVFPGTPRYGNNGPWRDGQASLLALDVRGITANTWNGYTEGYAIVPSCGRSPRGEGPPGLTPCDELSPGDGSDQAYLWFRALVPPGGSPARRPTTLAGTNQSSAVYSDTVTLTFTLMEALTGTPVTGRKVHFRLGKQLALGTTDGTGLAKAKITINQQPGAVPLVVSFDGDAEYLSREMQDSFLVAKEKTIVRWFADEDRSVVTRRTATMAALLVDDDAKPINNRAIAFTLGSGPASRKCSGVTRADGIARCQIDTSQLHGKQTVFIDFAGDAYYEPAAAKKVVVLNPSRFYNLNSGTNLRLER